MSFIRELLDIHSKKAKQPEQVSEARLMQFDDMVEVKIDPDRDDPTDLARKMIPAILSMAYVYLVEDKDKYERRHADYDPNDKEAEKPEDFPFTAEELFDRADDVIRHMKNSLDRIDHEDFALHVSMIEHTFKTKLSTKK